MDIEFDIGSAVENSCWNVVCKSVFENIQDIDRVNEEVMKLQESGTKSDVEVRDFQLLDAQRYYVDRAFKFTLQGIGVFSNEQILDMACNYIINKMNVLIEEMNNVTSVDVKSQMEHLTNDSMYSLYIHARCPSSLF